MSPNVHDIISTLRESQDAQEFDPFGFQPEFLRHIIPPVGWIYRHYFRVEVHGMEHIPDHGPVLLIANHSGQLPLDALMIGSACLLDKKPARMVRSMVERWSAELPFISWIFPRFGQVVGTRQNARTLLKQNNCLLVFPEGVRGISKTYDRAYQLQDFGLGFMRLALETNTPIVPIGVVGAEEQIPAIVNLRSLGKMLGAPSFPITPTWPLLGPIGALPLPTKLRLHFGKPMYFEGAHDDEDRVIRSQVYKVKDAIHDLLMHGLKQRRGIFT